MEYKALHVRILADDYEWLDRHSFETKMSKAEIIRRGLELYREKKARVMTKMGGGYKMEEPNKEIAKWIEENFHDKAVEIKDFPVFPFGKLLTDKNGDTMVVYWDILLEKLAYAFPFEKQ